MDDIQTTDATLYAQELDEQKGYRSAPQGPVKQSWAAIYRDYRDTPKHVVLHDLLYGIGGFSGEGIESDGTGYSYVTPLSTELQYLDRVRNSDLINHFSRYVNAQVNPVDAGQNEHEIRSGGDPVTDDDFEMFLDNANGRGVKYRAIRRSVLREVLAHDICYIITDRIGDRYYVQHKPITEISPEMEVDSSGALTMVVVYDYQQGKYTYASRWQMVDGRCVRTKMRAKTDNAKYWYNLKYEDVEPLPTTSDEMLVHPVIIGDTSYYPEHPESWSLARVCIDHFQQNNRHQWLQTLTRNPKLQAFGTIDGIRGAIGNALISEGDSGNNYPPAAQFIEPSNGNIAESAKCLETAVQSIREIASDHGVTINESAAGQSGESKKYDYDATEKACMRVESLAKEVDDVVVRMYKKFFNRGYDYVFVYAGSYTPESEVDVKDLLDTLAFSRQLGTPELVAEITKELSRKILGSKLSTERKRQITEEIENMAAQSDVSDM